MWKMRIIYTWGINIKWKFLRLKNVMNYCACNAFKVTAWDAVSNKYNNLCDISNLLKNKTFVFSTETNYINLCG